MACPHTERELLWAPSANPTDRLWRCAACGTILRYDDPRNKWVSIGYRAVPESAVSGEAQVIEPEQLHRLFARIRDVRGHGVTLREACTLVAKEAGVDPQELYRKYYASL